MPILQNPRHERFAQELAKGKTADEAYAAAGYKPDRGPASGLAANGNIRARVAELQAIGAEEAARGCASGALLSTQTAFLGAVALTVILPHFRRSIVSPLIFSALRGFLPSHGPERGANDAITI
jgi:hypothetical protein